MTRLMLFLATLGAALFLSASVATADTCACGQDINYHAYPIEQCYPDPLGRPGQMCTNPRDGWHYHGPVI